MIRHLRSHRRAGFTLVELFVAVSILSLIIVMVTRLFNSATVVTTAGNKRIDSDAHARPLLDRMAIDFGRMLKRSDIDYFFKNSSNPQNGNDHIAFFSMVPGYYPSSNFQSPLSLVAYRTSPRHHMERMGKGLLWNGVSSINTPLVFLPLTIVDFWPTATNAEADNDYELIGPQVFRFEYYFLLRNGSLSDTPWNTGAGTTSIAGLKDVAAIGVAIASIDPKSRVLLTESQLATLRDRLGDFVSGSTPGKLLDDWQGALNATNDMPRTAVASVRLYNRLFQLASR